MEKTIEAGSLLSHYRIIAAIGAGGMGQVYKAHDTLLERTVALKVLPPEVVRNDERVRRFMQEAKSASSLNHPNIVTIHEIGQASVSSSGDGQPSPDGAPIHYISMELIDGATLKRRIHDGVTDLRTLLGYLTQAAEGLAKAHAAGIVHRDLKPENIMVTRDGFTKVLDFGLAKLSMNKSASEGNTGATDVRGVTREGALLGTVVYMSPEQVRGEVVDHRSDIFSFGSILYEAATRQRPFDADSDIDVMHKILHDKPVPVDELDPKVPAELRRIIRRCLSKDPERRYQSIKDLAIELADVVDEFEELSASAASRSSGSISQPLMASPRQRATRVVWILVALLGAAALAVTGIITLRAKPEAAKKEPADFAKMRIDQLTTSGDVVSATISPDGKYVALVSNDRQGNIWLSVRQVATGATVQVVPPVKTPLGDITFSPDSNYVYYRKSEQESRNAYFVLYQVPSLGGTPRRIAFDVDSRVTFSPDGRQMAFGQGHPDVGQNWLVVTNADGSGPRKLTTFDRFGGSSPAWSPDGKTIVTTGGRVAGGLRFELTAVDAVSGKQSTIGKEHWAEISSAFWLPDGKAIVLTAKSELTSRFQVWLQPFPDGDRRRITNDLNQYDLASVTSDGGTIAVVRYEMDLQLVEVKSGSIAPFPVTPGSYSYQGLFAARGGVIFTTLGNEAGTDVAVFRPGADRPSFLTHDGRSGVATPSADGKTASFLSLRAGNVPHVFVADVESGSVRQVTSGSGEIGPSLSPDGRFLTYSTIKGELYRVAASGGTPIPIAPSIVAVAADAMTAPISPDGKRFVCRTFRTTDGRTEQRLIVGDVQSGKVISDIPWTFEEAAWTPSGDALVFVRRSAGFSNIFTMPAAGGAAKPVTSFMEGGIAAFAMSPEGRLFVVRGKARNDVVTIRDFR